MFRKTRRKIVASVTIALVFLLAITLAAIVWFEYRDAERKNADMLDHYIELYCLEEPPDEAAFPPPVPPDNGTHESSASYQLSAFYSVAFSDQDDAIAIDTGWSKLYSEHDLVDIARAVLASGDLSGKYDSLTYRVDERDDYVLVAFMDATTARENLLSLTRHALVVGTIAIIVLFFVAWAAAGKIVRPLEENDRRQKRFISDASHELKTPIAAISANVDLLASRIAPNEWLDNIRHECGRMNELVAQLLDLSRVESTRSPMKEIDLSRLVISEVLPFESVAFERGLAIESDIAENVHITGSRMQLSQLVSILVDNAITYAEDGEVRVSLNQRGRHAVLVVRNRGPEITSEQLVHLFDRFFRLNEARSVEDGHYGLGLSIAKAIVDAHGGDVSAACHDGFVEFTVALPL